MKLRTLLFLAVALFGFYLLSFGPGLYLTIKNERTVRNYVPRPAIEMVVTFYFPHLYAMAYSEIYYNYGKWWVEIAGEKVNKTYPEFRSHLLHK